MEKAKKSIEQMATYCGEECPFFKREDPDGYEICYLTGLVMSYTLECSFEDGLKQLTKEQAVKVLHHVQKWRRGAKIGMPPPALLGLAIDKAIRVLRQKIKDDK